MKMSKMKNQISFPGGKMTEGQKGLFELNDFVRKNIKSMKPYTSARDEFQGTDEDIVFLDANENPFENGVNRYPDPQQRRLKKLLSKVEFRSVILTNGQLPKLSVFILKITVLSFLETPGLCKITMNYAEKK